MKTILVTLALLATTSTFAKNSIDISVKGKSTILFRKITKNHFEKLSMETKGELNVTLNQEGKSTNILSQEQNTPDDGSRLSLYTLGNKVVRIDDESEKINKEVSAEIKRTLFLKRVEKVTISSETYKSLYSESMQKLGLDVLSKLNLGLGNGHNIQSNLDLSDLSCNAEEDILTCKQDLELKLSIK